MKSLSLISYAKVNLYLEVIKKQPDNYHSIFTLFERISLADKIRLRLLPRREIRIVTSGLSIPQGPDNLAYKAASLIQREHKITEGVELNIRKHIPISAGLGGGSSNAAVVLLGLNRLWKMKLRLRQLVAIARQIGADIPFFLYNVPFAYGSSRGDEIKVLRLPVKLWHIIVVPRIRVLSSLIYKKWDESRRVGKKTLTGLTNPQSIIRILKAALIKKDLLSLSELLTNSLEGVSANIYPAIKRIRLTLSDLGLEAISMSGSGAAVFGLVSSRKEAYTVARQLRALGNWDVFVAKTI